MAHFDLQYFQSTQGERNGAITWALTLHGDQLQRHVRKRFHQDSDDLYQDLVTELFRANFDKHRDLLESGDYDRLQGWFDNAAKWALSETHNRAAQTDFEQNVEITTDGDLPEYAFDPAAAGEPDPIDPQVITVLKNVRNQKVVQSLVLSSQGLGWDEIAQLVGFSSRQAAHRACNSPKVVRELAFAWRALKGDELCPEIATDLATVAWTVGDLDPEIQQRVNAHVATCPTCSAILETHKNTLAAAPAFFPMPAMLVLTNDSATSHAVAGLDAISAKFHNFIYWITGQSSTGTWSAPRAAGVATASVLLVGGGGAAVHKATTDRSSNDTSAATTPAPQSFYDQVNVPPVERPTPRPKHKKKTPKATQVAAPVAPAPQATSAPAQTSTPKQTTGDGSSEFLPEER
ncbi:MAG: hypothetical protein JHD02_00145 [Thermoleophilaceae bacterium]|nr:hypothetical protein [Thermoleophilaceae bacterium]